MKYLTPDLLARFRSGMIDSEEWEQAGAAYESRLKRIATKIPEEVLRPLTSICFHDAKILTVAADESPHLSIFLQLSDPNSQPKKYVELRYKLVGSIKASLDYFRHPSVAKDGKPLGWWLYDEIDLPERSRKGTFRHSILFTGGIEIQVTFRSITLNHRFFSPPEWLATEQDQPFAALQLLTA